MFGISIQRPIDSITRSCLLMNFIINHFVQEDFPEFKELPDDESREMLLAIGALYVEIYGENAANAHAVPIARLMKSQDYQSVIEEFYRLNQTLKQSLYKYLSIDPAKRVRHLSKMYRFKKIPRDAESTDQLIRKFESIWVDRSDLF